MEGKGILENYEGHDMFIVSGSGSGTGISVTGAAPVERDRERVLVSHRRWPALPRAARDSSAPAPASPSRVPPPCRLPRGREREREKERGREGESLFRIGGGLRCLRFLARRVPACA